MGSCTSKSSKNMAKGKSSIKPMQSGETEFVSFTKGYGDKQIVTVDANGNYLYKRYIPIYNAPIDTNTPEYKTALSLYNVRFAVNKDGSVTVSKGGLFSRKMNFKSKDAFRKEYTKRNEQLKKIYESQLKPIQEGKISQLRAESIKSIVRNKTSSEALKSINKSFLDDQKAILTRIKAADDMKSRFKML